MTGTQGLLSRLRSLADGLLAGAAGTAGPIVEVVEPGHIPRKMIASLYPDSPCYETDTLLASSLDAFAMKAASHEGRAPDSGGSTTPPPRLVFILGSARSGTTWLSTLMQIHPEAGGIGDKESWLFELLHPLWRNGSGGGGLAMHVPRDRLITLIRSFTDSLFLEASSASSAREKEVFIEKTPAHSFNIPMMRAVYPEAHYIHLIRDGRDVARSLSNMPMAGWPAPSRAAAGWRDTVAAVRRDAAGLNRYIEIRYEDLLADPPGQICRVLESVGLRTDDSVRADIQMAASARVSTWSDTNTAIGTKGGASLSSTALAGIYATAGRALVREGYLSESGLRRWSAHPAYLAVRYREYVLDLAGRGRAGIRARHRRQLDGG